MTALAARFSHLPANRQRPSHFLVRVSKKKEEAFSCRCDISNCFLFLFAFPPFSLGFVNATPPVSAARPPPACHAGDFDECAPGAVIIGGAGTAALDVMSGLLFTGSVKVTEGKRD